jgi:hypothetical protein
MRVKSYKEQAPGNHEFPEPRIKNYNPEFIEPGITSRRLSCAKQLL